MQHIFTNDIYTYFTAAFFVIVFIIVIFSLIKRKCGKRDNLSGFKSPTNIHGLIQVELERIDRMDGHDFEHYCAYLLKSFGYKDIEVTRGSGDQGVDILARLNNRKYAIQCKRVSGRLGNKPVQEVHTGRTIYGCDVAVVVTNNYFTDSAAAAAKAVDVLLCDRNSLIRLIEEKIKKENDLLKKYGRLTSEQMDIAEEAECMLQIYPMSKKRLINVLRKMNYSPENISVAISAMGINWKEHATRSGCIIAKDSGFSKNDLAEMLILFGFNVEEAEYGSQKCGLNTMSQAVDAAKIYCSMKDCSYTELFEQLIHDGFSHREAQFALKKCKCLIELDEQNEGFDLIDYFELIEDD